MVRRSVLRMTTAAVATVALAALGCASSGGDSDMDDTSGTNSEFIEETVTEEVVVEETVDIDTLASLQTIYFDFDSFNIRNDARPVLQSNANLIQQSPAGTVVVEGNCDERGSEEYNLALGEKRAEAVKSYLADLGVPSGRLYTVSFGESKPAVMGHDETAWRYNRRVDFGSR
jgi:peptidoglycan-associated lipoprotein